MARNLTQSSIRKLIVRLLESFEGFDTHLRLLVLVNILCEEPQENSFVFLFHRFS